MTLPRGRNAQRCRYSPQSGQGPAGEILRE